MDYSDMETQAGATESYVAIMLDDIARQYGTSSPAPDLGPTEGVVPLSYVPPSSHTTAQPAEDFQEHLSTLIEENNSTLRRNMMDFYKSMKNQLQAEQRSAVESERYAAALRLQTKQEEIELLKDDLAVTRDTSAESHACLLRACDQVSTLNERLRGKRYMAKYFKDWIRPIRWKKQKELNKARADNWFRVEKLQRRVMREWLRVVSAEMRRKANARIQAAIESTRHACEEKARQNSTGLRNQLQDTEKALSAEKQGREMLAQDMKRSFMRGVCALNMEAMQVMKRGMAPGGINPNPTTLQYVPSDDGEPQPEEVPANLQNMLSAMNMGTGGDSSNSTHRPGGAPRGHAVRHATG